MLRYVTAMETPLGAQVSIQISLTALSALLFPLLITAIWLSNLFIKWFRKLNFDIIIIVSVGIFCRATTPGLSESQLARRFLCMIIDYSLLDTGTCIPHQPSNCNNEEWGLTELLFYCKIFV